MLDVCVLLFNCENHRILKKVTLFGNGGLSCLLIPFCNGGHFILWEVNFIKRSTVYYNSYGPDCYTSDDTNFWEKMCAVLYAREQQETGNTGDQWTLRTDGIKTCIQGNDTKECGVFLIKTIDCILNEADPNTLQLEEMSLFRKQILFNFANFGRDIITVED